VSAVSPRNLPRVATVAPGPWRFAEFDGNGHLDLAIATSPLAWCRWLGARRFLVPRGGTFPMVSNYFRGLLHPTIGAPLDTIIARLSRHRRRRFQSLTEDSCMRLSCTSPAAVGSTYAGCATYENPRCETWVEASWSRRRREARAETRAHSSFAGSSDGLATAQWKLSQLTPGR
jgi:hypothetical protein